MALIIDSQLNIVPKSVNMERIIFFIRDLMKEGVIMKYISEPQRHLFQYCCRQQQIEQVEVCWYFLIEKNYFKIKIKFTYRNGFENYLFNQRLYSEVCIFLKILNSHPNQIFNFKMDKNGFIFTSLERTWNSFHPNIQTNFQNIIISAKNSIKRVQKISLPYLSLSLIKIKQQKITNQTQINYLTELNSLKYSYQQLRRIRNKATQIKFQSKQFDQEITELSKSLRIILPLTFRQSKIETKYLKEQIQQSKNMNDKVSINSILLGVYIKKVYNEKPLIVEGSHSVISIQKYDYSVIFTTSSISSEQVIQKGQESVIKEVTKGYLGKKKARSHKLESKNAFKNEMCFLKFMKQKTCKQIANYFKEYGKQDSIYIEVYEMDLHHFLSKIVSKQLTFSAYQKVVLAYQIVKGVNFINTNKICHRDLKPSNIMLTRQLHPKIIDFGSVSPIYGYHQFNVHSKKFLGTETYYHPYHQCNQYIKRMYTENQYLQHIFFDSYSLGQIIYRMFQQNIINLVNHQLIDTINYIVNVCSEANPDDRLSYQQILEALSLMLYYLHHLSIKEPFYETQSLKQKPSQKNQ